jgi:hypothetical protein
MSEFDEPITNLYKQARKLQRESIQTFSQVGEVYDPSKFNKPMPAFDKRRVFWDLDSDLLK